MTTRTQPELPPLPREIRQEFQAALEREFRKGSASTTEEQLAILGRLLERAESLGETPAGDGYINVNRELAIDYTNPRVIRQNASRTPIGDRVRIFAGIAIVLGGLVLMGLNFILSNSSHAAPQVTPTVVALGTGTPAPAPTALPVAQIKIDGKGVPAVFPVTLQIGGHAWAVTAAAVDAPGGNWQVTKAGNLANWLPGSVVNWCFGLWNDPDGANRGVLEAIGKDGADATMRMSSGVERHFHLGTGTPVSHLQSAIFAQHQPALTVLLLGSPGDSRLLLAGQEVTVAAQGAVPAVATSTPAR